MNLQKMDLNLFLVFDVIYETGNLTRAAQKLNKTQPAISNALSRMRGIVGDPLFIHAGKRMNPTPRAEELIEPVRAALALMHETLDPVINFDPVKSKRMIRISAGDIAETVILPEFIKRLRSEAPLVSLQVYQIHRRELSAKILANEVDFAVDIPMALEGDICQMPLLSDHQVCAISTKHQLAKKHELTLEEYLTAGHIHVSYRRRGGGVADLGLGKIGKSRNRVVRLQHHQAAFAMLEESDLILSAPSRLAALYPCRTFPLPFEAPPLDLQLYWHAAAQNIAFNRWARELLMNVAEDILSYQE